MESQKAFLMAAVAGLMAAAGVIGAPAPAQAHGEGGVPCYGINKCKSTGDCGGKGHGCHGHNACAGQGYLSLDSMETCLKIKDGRLTEQPETPAPSDAPTSG